MGGKKATSGSVEELDKLDIAVDSIPSEYVKSSGKEENLKAKVDALSISATPESLKPMERRKKRKTLDKEKHRTDSKSVDTPKVDALSISATPESLKPMERRKKRKTLDKEKHRTDSKSVDTPKSKKLRGDPDLAGTALRYSLSSLPEFHISVFKDLSSPELPVREGAVEALVLELHEIQNAYEKLGEKVTDRVDAQMEATKGDGLENCAPSLRYAVRRLIRGVSSSRECARQGFALALTIVVGTIPTIKMDAIMKLIINLLEVSASTKGQEARDCLLGRLFAYGALARSGRITAEWVADNNTLCVKDFISHVLSLAVKKRYLREPAVSVLLDLVEKLPVEALLSQVLEVPSIHEWFCKAGEVGDPDALLLALKLQERIPGDSDILGKLLPYPFSPNSFFTANHLSFLVPCFKESTFCQPRVHSLWPVLINFLIPEVASHDEDGVSNSCKKQKRSQNGNFPENIAQYICCFHEIVIEGSLLLSSHDRKHLAFDVLLLILPRLPASCIQVVLSQKLVNCLLDILSTKGSWLYNAAQHFLKELINWIGDDDDRRVSVIVSLQKYSNGRFDCITRTQTVKELVAEFNRGPGCMLFVHHLINLFVDDGGLTDEPSDLSQTTDENSERGSVDGKESAATLGSTEFLKNWVIDTLPRILKNLKLNHEAKNWTSTDFVTFLEEKYRVQTEILKFLSIQGLFSASLGNEVTSFDLEEKFKWPKVASSISVCKMCVEQIQLLLEDPLRGERLEENDLGSYFICFLSTLCCIPSVSLFRPLSSDDEKAFKKLQLMATRLSHEERNLRPGPHAGKLRPLRYLLIQLLLQVLLRPGEFSEAASELVICCQKAFPGVSQIDLMEEKDEFDDNGLPDLIDVLLDTVLSLLPQSSSSLCVAAEEVFRNFCDDISDDGLLRMLRVVKKDLKPARHQAIDNISDEDDDEDFLGIEDEEEETNEDKAVEISDDHAADAEEETYEAGDIEAGSNDDRADDSEGIVRVKVQPDQEEIEGHSVSDASDSEMDDEAMLQMDSYFTQLIRGRKNSAGNDSAHSQLIVFKLRVLSLLEMYLHRNPDNPQVLLIYSYLAQTVVKSYSAEGNKQLGERIGGILQKKIFKAKEYPKGNETLLPTLETLLEKSLKSASRSRHKVVSSLAQNSTFWILKVIHSGNFSDSQLERVFGIFQYVLLDYFDNKKCRLKSGFVKEVMRRHMWVGHQLFGFLLERCAGAKSEFRQVEALDVLDCILKSWIPTKRGGDKEDDASSKSKFLKTHLPLLCELIRQLLSRLPKKTSRRAEVRRFCSKVLHAVLILDLSKSFLKTLKPDAYSACEAQLGKLFHPFKKSIQ